MKNDMRNVEQLTGELADRGSETVKELASIFSSNIENVDHLFRKAVSSVKENPGQALGTALLAGIGIGVLLMKEKAKE